MAEAQYSSTDLTPAAPSRRPSPLALALLLAVVALAIFIGTNVLSVLYAVVAPPAPPLPPDMEQVSHDSPAYGVDHWTYTTTRDACEVVQYVQENGGVCVLAPMQCGEYRENSGDFSVGQSIVARCSGKIAFSIFHEQWSSVILRNLDDTVKYNLDREVYWMGTGPQ